MSAGNLSSGFSNRGNREKVNMKLTIVFIAIVVCLICSTVAFAGGGTPPSVPELGTAGILAALLVGGLIARKTIRRK
jgi:hypothetical protein